MNSAMPVRMTVLLAVLLPAGAASANPSHADPRAMLDLHQLTGDEPMLARAAQLWQQASQALDQASQNPARPSGRVLSQVQLQLLQLERLALDLQLHGETAGRDLELRLVPLNQQLNQLLGGLMASPAGAQQAASARLYLTSPRNQQQRAGRIQRIGRLVAEQNWVEAYDVFYEVVHDLRPATMYLSQSEEETYFTPLEEWTTRVPGQRNRLVREELCQRLGEAAERRLPRLEPLLGQLTAAADGLRSSDSVTVEGQLLSGPQCLVHFLNALEAVQVEALACRGIEWARLTDVPKAAALPPRTQPNRVDRVAYGEFCGRYFAALGQLVAADAERLPAERVPARYREYLAVLAPVVPRCADDRLAQTIQPSLDGLAAKVPELLVAVNAYEAATGELLRWKERVARSQAARHGVDCTASDELLLRAARSRAGAPVLLADPEPVLAEAQLLVAAPAAISAVLPEVIDQRVIVADVVGLGSVPFCIARYRNRHYARLTRPQVDAAIRQLEQELMIGDGLPPLSLAAAAAVASAERGDFVAVGGIARGVYLEGLIPRFATLVPAAAALVPLGILPEESPEQEMIQHVLLRLDVEPAWVQHRYFHLQLSPPAG